MRVRKRTGKEEKERGAGRMGDRERERREGQGQGERGAGRVGTGKWERERGVGKRIEGAVEWRHRDNGGRGELYSEFRGLHVMVILTGYIVHGSEAYVALSQSVPDNLIVYMNSAI